MNLRNRFILAVALSVLLLGANTALSTRFIPQRAESLGVTEENLARLQTISAVTGIPLNRVKITTWTPDTSDCVTEYAWDKESPMETRQHIPVSVSCADASKGVPLGLDRVTADWTKQRWTRPIVEKGLGAVLKENQDKNYSIGILAAERKLPPDQISWKVDRRTREVKIIAAGTEYLAADVIRNQPAGLELNPQKYLSASAWKAYEQRARGR